MAKGPLTRPTSSLFGYATPGRSIDPKAPPRCAFRSLCTRVPQLIPARAGAPIPEPIEFFTTDRMMLGYGDALVGYNVRSTAPPPSPTGHFLRRCPHTAIRHRRGEDLPTGPGRRVRGRSGWLTATAASRAFRDESGMRRASTWAVGQRLLTRDSAKGLALGGAARNSDRCRDSAACRCIGRALARRHKEFGGTRQGQDASEAIPAAAAGLRLVRRQ